jgi:Toluene-4-monooxygenase system protein B (TmoB)
VITSGSEFERKIEKTLPLEFLGRKFMPIPLYGFLQGDTVGLLILAEEADTLQALARKLQDAASLRVAARDRVQVVYNDKNMDPTMTVAQAGLQALDRFDVVPG